MDHRKFGDTYYVRMDRGDEVIAGLKKLCAENGIASATFFGIGGCRMAELQTFIPEKGSFETETLDGMLELINITGNIIRDESGEYAHHAHAIFSYKENGEHRVAAGHLKETTVLYTAEIELHPVVGGVIRRKHDPETNTGFWDFRDQ